MIADKSFGRLTFDSNSNKVSQETIYDIASLTKVIATTPVIMKLIKKKYLNLNHKINQFYPQFRGPFKDKVTIKHLLTHSSGLKPYVQYFKDKKYKNKTDIIDDIVVNQELIYKPGLDSRYSDLGMILLMDIAEKVTGRKFEELVQSWIFKPLNMKNSFFNPSKKLLYKIAPTERDSVFSGTDFFFFIMSSTNVQSENGPLPQEPTKFVLYLRISTGKSGGVDSNGIAAQERDINLFLDTQSAPEVVGKYVEVMSGANNERPRLNDALTLCRETGSQLLVSNLSRLSRDVEFTARLLKDKKIKLRVANLPNANNFQTRKRIHISTHEGSVTWMES